MRALVVLVLLCPACGGSPPAAETVTRAAPPPTSIRGVGPGLGTGTDIPGGTGNTISGVVPGRPELGERAPRASAELDAFVRMLLSADRATQSRHIDWDRQAAIATAVGADDTTTSLPPPVPYNPSRGLPVSVPAGCDPVFTEGGGYEQMGMPPPMDSWPQTVIDRIEQALNYLREGREVQAWCTVLREVQAGQDAQGEPVYEQRPVPGPFFILNIYRAPAGLRVQAWADLDGREEFVSPRP